MVGVRTTVRSAVSWTLILDRGHFSSMLMMLQVFATIIILFYCIAAFILFYTCRQHYMASEETAVNETMIMKSNE